MNHESYISFFDKKLIPLGFKRRKSDQEWKRKVGKKYSEWIHLNFGLYGINVSLGVNYLELKKMFTDDFGPIPATFVSLSKLTKKQYSEKSVAAEILSDLIDVGFNMFEELENKSDLIENLKQDDSTRWPVYCLSSRIRLLPLLLFSENRKEESFKCVDAFLKEFWDKDQFIPDYQTFKNCFEKLR